MPAIAVAGRPRDPDFANVTQAVVHAVLASATRASVAGRGVPNVQMPQDPQSLEHTFMAMFSDSNTRARQLRRAFARQSGRLSGSLTGVDFRDSRPVIEQVLGKRAANSPIMSRSALEVFRRSPRTQWSDLVLKNMGFPRLAAVPDDEPEPQSPPREAKQLVLRVKRVHCVQRVGWEATDWDGKDVILCGGLGFDSTLQSPPPAGSPSSAHYRKVPQFTVGTFPVDGGKKEYDPDKTFCTWDLTASGDWPRAFFAVIAVAEQDSGEEFAQLMEEIWQILSPVVLQAVSIAAVALTGFAIGSLVGTEVAPLIGTAVGGAVGAAIGAVVGVVIDSLRDDVLETADTPVSLLLPSRSQTFPGGSASDVYTSEYVRPRASGNYNLSYQWKLTY